jgi:riboflavin synthase
MFTGIVQTTGTVAQKESRGGDVRLDIRCPDLRPAELAVGDSIAVSGACLTAVEVGAEGFSADVSKETLEHTTLGQMEPGASVNLERALTLSTPLGGHLVTGHVDGVGEITARVEEARSVRFDIRVPSRLARYVARKGSVCVDGVSLTVNRVGDTDFDVNIVPHTIEVTALDEWAPGSRVNLEVDIVARYIERLLGEGQSGGLSMDKLREAGFA